MNPISRNEFLKQSSLAALATLLAPLANASSLGIADRKIKVAVIGCGSVSTQYLPHITKSPYVEVVATCDIIVERAKKAAEKYNVPNYYPHIDQLLAGSKFDLMLTLTDMQEHGRLNKQALLAGRNVW